MNLTLSFMPSFVNMLYPHGLDSLLEFLIKFLFCYVLYENSSRGMISLMESCDLINFA